MCSTKSHTKIFERSERKGSRDAPRERKVYEGKGKQIFQGHTVFVSEYDETWT
jgi:hypothetical protein